MGQETELAQTKRDETIAFVVLAVLLAPLIACAVVGGYSFLVWMFQIVLGPPGSVPGEGL